MVYGGLDTPGRSNLGLIPSSMSAMVDLRGSKSGFAELFFIVVAEKTAEGALMHMWQLELSSSGDEGEESDAETPQEEIGGSGSNVLVKSSKVSSQSLPLPPNIKVIHCVPAAGHLSSSS